MDQEEGFSFFPYMADYSCSDLDSSFTSSTTSSAASSFSARSSLSLPSFNNSNAAPDNGAALLPLPHSRCTDPRWSALNAVADLSPDGLLHLRHLRLLRPLGSGHLARVFHCRLQGVEAGDDDAYPSADFALKVIDLNMLSRSSSSSKLDRSDRGNDEEGDGKMWHIRAEARALAELDHPFLPTLYARLDASHYACFLIDYCSGGDLHCLLRRVRGHRLPPPAARFYAAEVLLALEYLHALGFVYRDLKPENVLLRADGHIMLSDFDLSFRSSVSPTLLRNRRSRPRHDRRRGNCIDGGSSRSEEDEDYELEFVAEPQGAYSKACVGTHEYLAPEVVSNVGHGSAVDWWAFGVFLYELLFGRSPFKGATKEATLRNILSQDVQFPETAGRNAAEDAQLAKAKDLISRLLVRDPRRRMGAARGAAEIKRHPFFESVRWPLVRRARPPFVPGAHVAASATPRAAPDRGPVASNEKKARGRWWWSSNSKSNNNLISRSSSFISKDSYYCDHNNKKRREGVTMGYGMFKMGVKCKNSKVNKNNSNSVEKK